MRALGPIGVHVKQGKLQCKLFSLTREFIAYLVEVLDQFAKVFNVSSKVVNMLINASFLQRRPTSDGLSRLGRLETGEI